jgi:hypothetical protein
MGFGFNLFFAFILLPITVILLVIWAFTRKPGFGQALGCLWIPVLALAFLSTMLKWVFEKKKLTKKDYYGSYIINRNYFAGKQADWQYDHFRFEIRDNDSIYFYITDKERISKIYKGTINTATNYESARLILNMETRTHHIVASNPTAIRCTWGFNLIFYSPKFNNVYFKKGEWEPVTYSP